MPAKPRILVVDDEAPIRRFFERVLADAGYDVQVAADGKSALTAIEGSTFELFVFDLMMPEMTGVELGRRIRVIEPEARILYVTGYSDALFDQKSVLWEHEAYVDKPISGPGLLEAVSLLMCGRTNSAPATSSDSA